MSLLSTFIQNQLLHAIEQQFMEHAPEIQETILAEVGAFAQKAIEWVQSKVSDSTMDDEKS